MAVAKKSENFLDFEDIEPEHYMRRIEMVA
jgi:hypothetical protein